MNYQFVKQENWNDCGLACLAMIIENYHHQRISLYAIKEHLDSISVHGLSFFELIQLGKIYHLQGEGFNCELAMLKENAHHCPFILNVKNEQGASHYVVLNQIVNDHYYINDPAQQESLIKLNVQELELIFLNKILLFQKHGKLKIQINWLSLFNWIFKYWINLLFLILVNVFSHCCFLFSATFIKAFSQWLNQGQINWMQFGVFCFSTFCGCCFEFGQTLFLAILQKKTADDLLKQFLMQEPKIGLTERTLMHRLIDFQEAIEFLQLLWHLLIQTIISLIFLPILTLWIQKINGLFCFLPWIFFVIVFFIKVFFCNKISFNQPEQKNKKQHYAWLLNQYLFQQPLIINRQLATTFCKKIQTEANVTQKLNQKMVLNQSIIQGWEKFWSKIFYFILLVVVYFSIFAQQIDYTNLIYLSLLTNYYLTLLIQMSTRWLNCYFNRTWFHHLNWMEQAKLELTPLTKVHKLTYGDYALDSTSLPQPKLQNFTTSFLIQGLPKITSQFFDHFLWPKVDDKTIQINGVQLVTMEKNWFFLASDQELISGTILENAFNWQQTIDQELFQALKPLLWLEKYGVDLLTVDYQQKLSYQQKQLINFLSAFFTSTPLFLFDDCLNSLPITDQQTLIQLFLTLKSQSFVIFATPNFGWENIFPQKLLLDPMI